MLLARESLLSKPVPTRSTKALPERVDPISSWLLAAEETGEFLGIRFGHILSGQSAPEWSFLSSVGFDGIGGFAELLRRGGAQLPRLPQLKHPATASVWRLLRGWTSYARPRQHVKWSSMEGTPEISSSHQAPTAVAWHVFDEQTTLRLRQVCRKQLISVNSFLLRHLTRAIRAHVLDQSSPIPWMVPVNMRGKIERERDTANATSYIGVKVCSYEAGPDVHRSIYAALGRGEHWANWYARYAGKYLGMPLKKLLIRAERYTSQRNLGCFANLGAWDPEKQITLPHLSGSWLFCPPVFRWLPVGAGAVTFQNRLSLTIQAHPELTTSSNTLWLWIQNWVKEIQFDLASI